MVLLAKSKVKTAESIALDPSDLLTYQVNAPQFAVKPPTLAAFASVQLKTLTASLTLYVKAGEANFTVSIVKVSEEHGFFTTMLKAYVFGTIVHSVYCTLTNIL